MKLNGKAWRKLTAKEYSELFPAKPKAIRRIAYGLRKASVMEARDGQMRPFTIAEWELARICGVSRRTLQRYIPLFESYGVLEVKRWRHREIGAMPNTYLLFLGAVIPEDFTFGGGDFPISAVQRREHSR